MGVSSMNILFALAFLRGISVGYGLKCYACASTKSWADCASNKIEVTCPSNQETCGKAFIHGNAGNISRKAFVTSCSVKSACNQDQCKALSQRGFAVNKCEVDCCDNDLCNEPKKTVSLKCYKCLSTKSWDDCASVQKAVACDSDEDTCVKIHYDAKSVDMAMSVESYVKYCHPKLSCDKDLCKTLVLPKGATVNKCKINCCEGNLCNGARVPLVSAILLLACAALTFFC